MFWSTLVATHGYVFWVFGKPTALERLWGAKWDTIRNESRVSPMKHIINHSNHQPNQSNKQTINRWIDQLEICGKTRGHEMQKQTHQQHGDYIRVANIQARERVLWGVNTLYRIIDFTPTSRLKLNALLGRRRRREATPRPKRSSKKQRTNRHDPLSTEQES